MLKNRNLHRWRPILDRKCDGKSTHVKSTPNSAKPTNSPSRFVYDTLLHISLYLQFENICAFAKGPLPIWLLFCHLRMPEFQHKRAGIAQTQSSHHVANGNGKSTRMHWLQPRSVELQGRFDYHWLQRLGGPIPDIFVDSFRHKADVEL